MPKYCKKIFFLLLLFPASLFAQDIAGTWTGRLLANGNELSYEMVISGGEDAWTGYALTVFTIDGKESMGVKSLKIKKKNGLFLIADEDMIYNNYATPPRRVRLFSQLSLKTDGPVMVLSGDFQTKSIDYRSQDKNAYSGTITLQKQNSLAQTKLVLKLQELNLMGATVKDRSAPPLVKTDPVVAAPEKPVAYAAVGGTAGIAVSKGKGVSAEPPVARAMPVQQPAPVQAAAEVLLRKTEVIRSISFAADSLVLTLYDNGIVDGDTVSVVLNNKVIIARQGLSEKAYRLVVPVPRVMGDSLQLIMYAENLGSIPPNTGLLIIEDGETRHEIRFEGDLHKSAAVILRRGR